MQLLLSDVLLKSISMFWPKHLSASGHEFIRKSCKPMTARHLHFPSEKYEGIY